MAGKPRLSEFIQELIRWRWAQRPTLQSLSDEYGVSHSCISDILNPHLRKRRKKKYNDQKKKEYQLPEVSNLQHSYSARKASRRKA